jgi:TPP-dependent pyruvate/acetoin dehydrogenase alpha subunit
MRLSKELKIDLFKRMLLIRRFEEKIKSLYNEGAVVGAIHLYIGQEAVAAGVCGALNDDDYVFSTHRGHGHALAKGCSLKSVMAEIMGKGTGLCGGHGGSMHLYDSLKGLMGGNGIVGGGIPLSLGAAFSAQYRSTKQVSVVFFSDGASNQGTFGESMNLAALFNLPVIFICENNRYAATTPVGLSTARQDIAGRAAGYGVRSLTVDGNNVTAVYEAAYMAVERARGGEGPTLVECQTYRVEPHCGIIPDQREKGERETWAAKDPVTNFKNILLKEMVILEDDVLDIENEIRDRLTGAVEYAEKSPWPDPESGVNKTCITD